MYGAPEFRGNCEFEPCVRSTRILPPEQYAIEREGRGRGGWMRRGEGRELREIKKERREGLVWSVYRTVKGSSPAIVHTHRDDVILSIRIM